MKTKELVTIEFRYSEAPEFEDDLTNKTKKITVGVFDTFNEATEEGNKALEIFEKHFKLNPNYNKKKRFSKNGGAFGYPKRLITNLGYIQTDFEFYAKITELKYNDIESTILEVSKSQKRHRNSKI
jgi:hypothetical protein